MTNTKQILFKVARSLISGFLFSGPIMLAFAVALLTSLGYLFYTILVLGAIFGLPWSFILGAGTISLADANSPATHEFFAQIIPGNTEWDAVFGWAMAVVVCSAHINGIVILSIRRRRAR